MSAYFITKKMDGLVGFIIIILFFFDELQCWMIIVISHWTGRDSAEETFEFKVTRSRPMRIGAN